MAKSDLNTIKEMLKRRGFEAVLYNPVQYLFFPPDTAPEALDDIYGMMKRYAFRIFVREAIKRKESFRAGDLVKYSTLKCVEAYLEFLLERGVVERTGEDTYRLSAQQVLSFGDSLEWFVARAMEKEFSAPALWGVRLTGAAAGGDYDVIASVEGQLMYAEVKSSPPKNIEEAEVAAFVRRTTSLHPAFAIFAEDTRLRMGDKIVPIFGEVLKDKGLEIRRLGEETFSIEDKVYIMNSKPDMIGNIGLCVQRYLTSKVFW